MVERACGPQPHKGVNCGVIVVAGNQIVHDDGLIRVRVSRYRAIDNVVAVAKAVVDIAKGIRGTCRPAKSHSGIRLGRHRSSIAHHHHTSCRSSVRIGSDRVAECHCQVSVERHVEIRCRRRRRRAADNASRIEHEAVVRGQRIHTQRRLLRDSDLHWGVIRSRSQHEISHQSPGVCRQRFLEEIKIGRVHPLQEQPAISRIGTRRHEGRVPARLRSAHGRRAILHFPIIDVVFRSARTCGMVGRRI